MRLIAELVLDSSILEAVFSSSGDSIWVHVGAEWERWLIPSLTVVEKLDQEQVLGTPYETISRLAVRSRPDSLLLVTHGFGVARLRLLEVAAGDPRTGKQVGDWFLDDLLSVDVVGVLYHDFMYDDPELTRHIECFGVTPDFRWALLGVDHHGLFLVESSARQRVRFFELPEPTEAGLSADASWVAWTTDEGGLMRAGQASAWKPESIAPGFVVVKEVRTDGTVVGIGDGQFSIFGPRPGVRKRWPWSTWFVYDAALIQDGFAILLGHGFEPNRAISCLALLEMSTDRIWPWLKFSVSTVKSENSELTQPVYPHIVANATGEWAAMYDLAGNFRLINTT